MELSIAISLIEKGVESTSTPQTWADLGAGAGLFTQAIATQLTEGSTIYAIDKNQKHEIDAGIPTIKIVPLQKDFEKDDIGLTNLDGMVLANSLHFIKDKVTLLTRLKGLLKNNGRLVIVEYDKISANQWVPYPIGFNELNETAGEAGFNSILKLNEYPSQFHQAVIYSAIMMNK